MADGNVFAAPTGSSALFLDENVVQGGFDADESNVDLAAMKALMDETPEETAEILKVNLILLDLCKRHSRVADRLPNSDNIASYFGPFDKTAREPCQGFCCHIWLCVVMLCKGVTKIP